MFTISCELSITDNHGNKKNSNIAICRSFTLLLNNKLRIALPSQDIHNYTTKNPTSGKKCCKNF